MAENCEHCTPTRPDQLTRHRRAFIELERERDALRAEVERLKAQALVWISVDERLPENGTFCIVYNRVLNCVMGGIFYDAWSDNTGFDYDDGDITHWMPLPSMPEGESEAEE